MSRYRVDQVALGLQDSDQLRQKLSSKLRIRSSCALSAISIYCRVRDHFIAAQGKAYLRGGFDRNPLKN